MIQIKHITKEFKVLNRHEGLKGSLRDLFSRDYKIVRAVDDISMEIAPGGMVGYLGPNGAGKSTTMLFLHDPCRYAGTVAIPAWFRDNDCRKSYLSGADLFSLEVHFRLRRNGCGQRHDLSAHVPGDVFFNGRDDPPGSQSAVLSGIRAVGSDHQFLH